MAHGVRMPWRLKTMTFSRERDELGAPAARAQPPKLASSTRTSVAASVMTVPEPVGIGPLIVRLDCQLSGDRRRTHAQPLCSPSASPPAEMPPASAPRTAVGGGSGRAIPRAREAAPRPARAERGGTRVLLRRWRRIAVLSAVIDGRP